VALRACGGEADTPVTDKHGGIAAELLLAAGPFIKEHNLGRVRAAETGFLISSPGEPDTVLAPDFAFVRARESEAPTDGYSRLTPDLVAEVASPSQTRAEIAAKARQWLRAGVRLVWIVLPKSQTVEVWHDGELQHILTIQDELSGEEVLPGFAYPIRNLFP